MDVHKDSMEDIPGYMGTYIYIYHVHTCSGLEV